MRALVLFILLVLTVAPAFAQAVIQAADAQKHVGQTITVEGVVAEVHQDGRSGVTFIDLGDQFPKEVFTGVIFKDDTNKFPSVDRLRGKIIDLTGEVQIYHDKRGRDRTEMILHDPGQLKVKP